MSLRLTHIELAEANKFVNELHRHHKPVAGHRFSLGALKDGVLVGVAIVGRPVAPKTDYKRVVEVLRLCTDGTRNACSFLYGASAKAAKALGYERIQTFTLPEEGGASLRAVGWVNEGLTESRENTSGWQSRPGRRSDQPKGPKYRWSLLLCLLYLCGLLLGV